MAAAIWRGNKRVVGRVGGGGVKNDELAARRRVLAVRCKEMVDATVLGLSWVVYYELRRACGSKGVGGEGAAIALGPRHTVRGSAMLAGKTG